MQHNWKLFLLLFLIMAICIIPAAGDNNDPSGESSDKPVEEDPFGDPFDQVQKEPENEEEDKSVTPEVSITRPDVLLSWEIGYYPVLKLKTGEEPLFVSNLITGKTDIHYSLGQCSATGSFTLDIDPYNIPQDDDFYRLSINELFCGYHAGFIDMKAGYFIVDWSQMNVFPLTNYFNTETSFYFDLDLFGFDPDDFDLEVDYSLFTDQEQENDALCGVHLLFYYSLFSLELIAHPPFFFNKQATSVSDAVNNNFTFPANIKTTTIDDPPAFSPWNIEYAARFGMTISSLDFYLSYFHGYDKRMLYTTVTLPSLPENLNIEIAREYTLLDKIGASVSYDLYGMIIHGEMVMSFSDPVLYYKTTTYPEPLGDIIDTKIKNIMTLVISAGFDWEIFSSFRLVVEYTDSFLLEDVPDVQEETLFGDTLFGGVYYTLPLLRSELTFTEGILFDWSGNEITSINKIKYDFLNGFAFEFSLFYFHIAEETDATSDSFKIMNKNIITGLYVVLTI